MAKENQRFAVGFEVRTSYNAFFGSTDFIVKNDVIYAVEEKVDIDLENSEEYCTQYKYVREITHSLEDMAEGERDSEYKKLYRWVNDHSQMLLEHMASGEEFVDYGKYYLKVYNVRPLLDVDLSPENYARLRSIEKKDMGNEEFIKAMLDKLLDHKFMLQSLTIKGCPMSVYKDIEHCEKLLGE